MSKEIYKGEQRYRCDFCRKLIAKEQRVFIFQEGFFCSASHATRKYQLGLFSPYSNTGVNRAVAESDGSHEQ